MSPKLDKVETDDETETNSIKKMAELEALLKEKTHLEETYLHQLKYARADLDNLQKHIERRIDEGVTREKEKLVKQILPIAEELDLALDETRKIRNSNLLEGIDMVKRKLWKVLYCEGVCPIEAVGKTFDPHMHEAVLEVETHDHPDGIVIQEVSKGYLLDGKVLKPSKVKVARNSSLTVQKVSEI
jgi:molecular chaperone GrpE